MSESNSIEFNTIEFIADQLSPVTRIERRNLLIASTTGILIAKVGLIPTKISIFGITLSSPAQDTLVVIVALTIFYFFCAFIMYGITDFFIWRKKYQDYLENVGAYIEGYNKKIPHYNEGFFNEFYLSNLKDRFTNEEIEETKHKYLKHLYFKRLEMASKIAWLYRMAGPVARIRSFFEYGLPIVISLYALYVTMDILNPFV